MGMLSVSAKVVTFFALPSGPRVFQDYEPIFAGPTHGGERIFGCGCDPEPSFRIEAHLNRFQDVRLTGDEFALETGRQFEGFALFFGSLRIGRCDDRLTERRPRA